MKVWYVLGIFAQGKLIAPVIERHLESSWWHDRFFEFMAAKCEDLKAPEGAYIAWDKYQ